MEKQANEWYRQAEYDLDTAQYMFDGGRYFYAVFMCHLAIEKAFKGLYCEKRQEVPPKIHNLLYFIDKLHLTPSEELGVFISNLNNSRTVTRYPEELDKAISEFTSSLAQEIIKKSQDTHQWIKKQR